MRRKAVARLLRLLRPAPMRERMWCALCRYPGMAEFMLGTVAATGEEHARRELARLWAEISPHPMPEILAVMPGQLVFQGDTE